MPNPDSRLRLVPILLAQAVGLGCGVASVRLNSYLIPPGTLGIYGLFLTFAPIGSVVLYAGLGKYIGRHWAAAPDRAALLRGIAVIAVRRLPWLAAAAVGGAATFGLGATDTVLAAAALFGTAVGLSVLGFAQSALQAERAHWRDCALSTVASLTRSFLPPLFFAAAGGLGALWSAFGLHAAAVALLGAWFLGAGWRTEAAAATLPDVYRGPMFVVLSVAGWLLTGVNRWIVSWRFGVVEAGYYTLAGGAAVVATAVLGIVMLQYLQPGFYALGDGPATDRARLARRVDLGAAAYALAAAGGLMLLNLIAPHLVGPLISEAYRESLKWLVPAGCFGLAVMTGNFYHSLLLAGRRESSCGRVDLASAAVLAGGGVLAALAGETAFARWLVVSPLVPWALTRPLARRAFFRPA